jgi:outer membrane protein TolC
MRTPFLLLFLTLTTAAQAETVTVRFDDLPALIASQNRRVLAGEDLAASEKSRTGHLTRSFLPHVKAYGGGEAFQTGDFGEMTQPVGGVEGRINLFRGGRDGLEEKIRKGLAAISESALEQRSREELLRARRLFSEILFYRQKISDLKEAISLCRQTTGLVQRRIDAGLTTETDRLEFDITRRQFEQELALAQEDYEHTVDELRIVLGLTDGLDVQGSLSHFHDADLEEARLKSREHPEVKQLQGQKEISQMQKKQSNRWWTPSVDLYGGYTLYPFRERERFSLGGRDEAVVGGRITFEIFDGLNSSAEAAAQKHRAAAFRQEAARKGEEVEGLFRRLQHELKARHEVVHLIERNLSEGRRYLSLSTEEYERGVKNSRDMLASLQRFLDQERNHSTALMEYLTVKSELLGLLGR